MNRALNREILRLSIPSILANITVPLVGMADTAIAGHLPGASATFIGAVSVGSMFFSLLYWSFGFLRTGTGGLTAQAFGRGDMRDCGRILTRGVGLALMVAAATLVLQLPFIRLAIMVTNASPEVEALAESYFRIRIWAAPATLSLMTFRGWFVGMQNSVDSMWADLTVNTVNIGASVVLAFGAGEWEGMGFEGIAAGTVIAQYCGLLYCIAVFALKYRKKVLAGFSLREAAKTIGGRGNGFGAFMKMNANLLGRSFFFITIYMGYTMIAAGYGDLTLSVSSIMMQLLMLFSYFTDGFAYAGEALTGRFIGAADEAMMRKSVKYVFLWSMSITGAFMLFYHFAGTPLLRLMTSDEAVIAACRGYLPWLLLMPPIGCAAFTWDGIFLGATASAPLRNSMAGAAAAFFAVWYIGKWLLDPTDPAAIHLLFASYFAHLAFRTVFLSVKYRRGFRRMP